MLSISSTSSVSSLKASRAAVTNRCRERVGGPLGGCGDPLVETKSLYAIVNSAQGVRTEAREFNPRSSREIPPAYDLQLLPQHQIVPLAQMPSFAPVQFQQDRPEVASFQCGQEGGIVRIEREVLQEG